MKCPNCQTELPSGARFCFHCGAPQQPQAQSREQAPKARVRLDGNVEQQLTEQFFQALRQRVEEEHSPGKANAYSERLYESGFRDTAFRRFGQLGEELKALERNGRADTRQINRKVELLFEGLLDYFLIHYCQDINSFALPEAILKYEGRAWKDIDLFQMVLDYLAFEQEPNEVVYLDFLKMPVEKLKNAGKFFLFPEREERIFFICNQSLLGSCKEGFAMTERGLYWKAQLQTARKLTFDNLDEVRREQDWLLLNGHFFHASPSIDLKLMRLLKKIRLIRPL